MEEAAAGELANLCSICYYEWMNKKIIFSTILVTSYLFLFATSQTVHALSIEITLQGKVTLYSGSVLGDEVEAQELREIEERRRMEVNTQNQESVEKTARQKMELKEAAARKERRVIKTLPESSKEKIRIREEKENIKLRVENGEEKGDAKLRKVEELEDKRIDATFPAQLKLDENSTEKRKQAVMDRQLRKDEKIELRAEKKENGEAEFELVSRAVRAKSNGAEFVLDPVTNQITITTPSGNQHVLVHLPDQAIENMQAKGLLTDEEVPELELTELSNGEVGYKAQVVRRKKLFGLFSREVPTEILMSDQVGTVVEQEVDDSWTNTVLNWVSTE